MCRASSDSSTRARPKSQIWKTGIRVLCSLFNPRSYILTNNTGKWSITPLLKRKEPENVTHRASWNSVLQCFPHTGYTWPVHPCTEYWRFPTYILPHLSIDTSDSSTISRKKSKYFIPSVVNSLCWEKSILPKVGLKHLVHPWSLPT